MYKLSPSKAHRFLTCTKSLEFDVDFVESPVTIRGSLLHSIAEKMVLSQEIDHLIEEHKINEYEMFLMKEYAKKAWSEYHRISAHTMLVEQKTTMNIYGFSINLVIDVLVYNDTHASIIDLKTGNNNVDVADNEQLMFYGFSTIQTHPNIEEFTLSIFQKGKLKSITKTRSEILDFFMNTENIFESIKNNELTYQPSDKGCKYCAIKGSCMERARWIINGKS
jgi:hypothetical protein